MTASYANTVTEDRASEPTAFPNDTGGLSMSHSIMRGDIQRGHNHKEKKTVTNNANNNASPSFVHSSSFRSHTQAAHMTYFPSAGGLFAFVRLYQMKRNTAHIIQKPMMLATNHGLSAGMSVLSQSMTI